MSSYLIIENPSQHPEDELYYESLSNEYIRLNTLMDEMKLELFLENYNKKTLEEMQKFFK